MNILMVTNTYLPHVGGVANSVAVFTKYLRKHGHNVKVIAPEYKEDNSSDPYIIRVPAIQHFNGSDFSVVLPIPHFLENDLKDFTPDVIHSHHPFLMGSMAVRLSKKYVVPLIFTQHTMFEDYTHYVPVDFGDMKKFVISLSTGYANLCDRVVAPSQSVADILKGRGVETPISIIPTGVEMDKFTKGNGSTFREKHNIPEDAFLAGHIGRLAQEKNLMFLTRSVSKFLKENHHAHFFVGGYGPSQEPMQKHFQENGLQKQVHFAGKLTGQETIDAYHAMDLFVFSSKSETQGMVLTEAMSAKVPVIAIDASGVREVLKDGQNGFMLDNESEDDFAQAINKYYNLSEQDKNKIKENAFETAKEFSMENCVMSLVEVYHQLKSLNMQERDMDESIWKKSTELAKTQWDLFTNLTSAVVDAVQSETKANK